MCGIARVWWECLFCWLTVSLSGFCIACLSATRRKRTSRSRANWWRHLRADIRSLFRGGALLHAGLQLAEEIKILFEVTRQEKILPNSLARLAAHLIAQFLIVDQFHHAPGCFFD